MRPSAIVACFAVLAVAGIALATRDGDPDGVTAGREGISGSAKQAPLAGCESLVEARVPPPAEHDMVIGPVVLQGARARANDSPSHYARRHGNDPVAKVPVILRPNSRVVIRVAARDRAIASLQYREATRGATRVHEGDRAVRFRACFRDNPTGWPGGLLLKGPSCVAITLALPGRGIARRTLRFGRRAC